MTSQASVYDWQTAAGRLQTVAQLLWVCTATQHAAQQFLQLAPGIVPSLLGKHMKFRTQHHIRYSARDCTRAAPMCSQRQTHTHISTFTAIAACCFKLRMVPMHVMRAC